MVLVSLKVETMTCLFCNYLKNVISVDKKPESMKFLNLIFVSVEIKELKHKFYTLQLVEGQFFPLMNYLWWIEKIVPKNMIKYFVHK